MATQKIKIHAALSIEERETVAEVVTSPGWKPLMKLIEELVKEQEFAVIRLSIDSGVDGIIHAKLKSEGARKLASEIANLKDIVREIKN